MRTAFLLILGMILMGCASQSYLETPRDKFTGELEVRWVKNDYFLFLPKKEDPLTLVRANGETIQPGSMYTDGGSIPRLLWEVKGYSPWGYAPAYIIHDWLFEAHRCDLSPDNKYTFEDSVTVMAEGLKALMEQNPEVRNYFVFDSVVAAVGSSIAEELWDKRLCNKLLRQVQTLPEGKLLMTIKFE